MARTGHGAGDSRVVTGRVTTGPSTSTEGGRTVSAPIRPTVTVSGPSRRPSTGVPTVRPVRVVTGATPTTRGVTVTHRPTRSLRLPGRRAGVVSRHGRVLVRRRAVVGPTQPSTRRDSRGSYRHRRPPSRRMGTRVPHSTSATTGRGPTCAGTSPGYRTRCATASTSASPRATRRPPCRATRPTSTGAGYTRSPTPTQRRSRLVPPTPSAAPPTSSRATTGRTR